MIKAVTLVFSKIQQLSVRDIRAKFGIFTSLESLDIGHSSDKGISNFRNSRTSNDIDMKLGPVTKRNKRNTKTQKNLTMTPCQQIVTSL